MKQKSGYIIGGLAVAGFCILALATRIHMWYAELLVSIAPQVATVLVALSLIALGILLLQKGSLLKLQPKYAMAIVAVGIGIVGIWSAAASSAQDPSISRADSTTSIRFATFNKLHSNTNYQLITEYMQEQNVDVAAFQETNAEQLAHIQNSSGYTYSASAYSVNPSMESTVGFVSRIPVNASSITDLGDGYTIMRAVMQPKDTQPVAFYSVHIPPPFTKKMFDHGNKSFDIVTELIANDTLPVIIGGDFNTTPYSPKLQDFNAATNGTIRAAQNELLPKCSWYGKGPLVCMRIDHIYISVSAQHISTTISPELGSDHRMIITELRL